MAIRLYHNPRCSKSRQALALLQEQGLEIDTWWYLQEPLTLAELSDLQQRLNMPVRDWVRQREAKEIGVTPNTADEQSLLQAIAAHPILMQRPIAVRGRHALIARPPERVLELL